MYGVLMVLGLAITLGMLPLVIREYRAMKRRMRDEYPENYVESQRSVDGGTGPGLRFTGPTAMRDGAKAFVRMPRIAGRFWGCALIAFAGWGLFVVSALLRRQ